MTRHLRSSDTDPCSPLTNGRPDRPDQHTQDGLPGEISWGGANPDVATPIATQNLGRPPAPCTECSADVVSTLLPLAQGYYLATVTAVGPGVTYRSEAFRFIR